MQWTPEQDRALLDVRDWLNDRGSQLYRLFGYAGTGKTTLAKHLAESVHGSVLFAAYTGKAAHVLRQKGCPAQTIHSLIYQPKEKSKQAVRHLEAELEKLRGELAARGLSAQEIEDYKRIIDIKKLLASARAETQRPMFALNEESPMRSAALTVIDECSMIDARMGEDLLSFGGKILVLGDPAQLPPVKGEGFFTNARPDFILKDVQRQAKDNPILHLATMVREGKRLKPGQYGDSLVLAPGSRLEDPLGYEQAIVGRNRTRHVWNQRYRALHGRGQELPEPGDRLVCLRNESEQGLLNGAIWTTVSSRFADPFLLMEVQPEEGGPIVECDVHVGHFNGSEVEFWERKKAQEFAYGYALTAHKSQGSQWNTVLINDESSCFRQDANKWLYTAITRAAERVTVLQT